MGEWLEKVLEMTRNKEQNEFEAIEQKVINCFRKANER